MSVPLPKSLYCGCVEHDTISNHQRHSRELGSLAGGVERMPRVLTTGSYAWETLSAMDRIQTWWLNGPVNMLPLR